MNPPSPSDSVAERKAGLPTAPQLAIPPIGDEEVSEQARRWVSRLKEHASSPTAAPTEFRPVDSFSWGLAQPALGLRLLLSNGDLLVRGLVPAALFLVACVVVMDWTEITGGWTLLTAYYAALAAAAPISPVLFTRNYAKLAAESRRYLDVPRHDPYLRSFGQAFIESVLQLILVAVGVAPIVALVALLPWFGGVWAALIVPVWTLHWIVVEGFDSARTLAPDVDPEQMDARADLLDPPWYAGHRLGELRAPLPKLLLPLRVWGRILARLGRRWRGEVEMIETRPWVAVGFGVGAATLLAIPGINFLFRPAVVIAASHVLGRLEPELGECAQPEGERSTDTKVSGAES